MSVCHSSFIHSVPTPVSRSERLLLLADGYCRGVSYKKTNQLLTLRLFPVFPYEYLFHALQPQVVCCLTVERTWRSPQATVWCVLESELSCCSSHFSCVGRSKTVQAGLYVCSLWVTDNVVPNLYSFPIVQTTADTHSQHTCFTPLLHRKGCWVVIPRS